MVYIEDTEPENLSTKDITPQYKVNDYVRIYHKPSPLQKSSLTYKWSRELYKVTDIDTTRMPIMYVVKNCNTGVESQRKYYHWELLASKCKPVVQSIIQTRKQSKKNPENLRQAARTHRPVTRSLTQKARKRSK